MHLLAVVACLLSVIAEATIMYTEHMAVHYTTYWFVNLELLNFTTWYTTEIHILKWLDATMVTTISGLSILQPKRLWSMKITGCKSLSQLGASGGALFPGLSCVSITIPA